MGSALAARKTWRAAKSRFFCSGEWQKKTKNPAFPQKTFFLRAENGKREAPGEPPS
jgi:hypothetical protein